MAKKKNTKKKISKKFIGGTFYNKKLSRTVKIEEKNAGILDFAGADVFEKSESKPKELNDSDRSE